MLKYKQLFIQYMEREGIKYTDIDERAVRVGYNGDNLNSIPVYVLFDKDDKPFVSYKCWEIAKFPADKKAAGILACNALNAKYRWVKFYVDDDNDLIAEMDTLVDEETCGMECATSVQRIVGIVDEAYPVIMKSIWA